MTVLAIDHVQIAMPEGQEEKACSFYRDLLGIPEVGKPANLALRGGCWFERAALKVHLGVEKDFQPARKAHPAFLVTGLAALILKLGGAGYRVTSDEPLEGYERVYVNDPFGNRLELIEKKLRA
jgi:catechol 2,3-dioxygenase-like lactoylglutathione lyase family enzyme